MGNEHSSSGGRGEGIPFVEWNGVFHFAEPSSYKYTPGRKRITKEIRFADPPKADTALANSEQLQGKIVVVERGGRMHFPDIIRRLLEAGVQGCLFIERDEYRGPQSAYEGFHSSGRQKVTIPILRMSKFHADKLLKDRPSAVTIVSLSGNEATDKLLPHDYPVAVTVAARSGEVAVLKHMLYGGELTPEKLPAALALCDAVEYDNLDCLEALHEFGVSLDSQKMNGETPLMTACHLGKTEIVRALILYGASLEIEDVHGMTALMVAAREGHSQCVKYLIRKGASTTLSRNRTRGTTALHIAARSGSVECIRYLLEAGAPIDMESPNSSTALMEAARSGKSDCVKLLVDSGAKLDTVDKEGNTAKDLARNAGHERIEEYLESISENESMKDQRRTIEEYIRSRYFTVEGLLKLETTRNMDLNVLKQLSIRNVAFMKLLREERVVHEVLRLITCPAQKNEDPDPCYGYYRVQEYCCDIAMSYDCQVFGVSPPGVYYKPSGNESNSSDQTVAKHKKKNSSKQHFQCFNILFNFLRQTGSLDEILLILFSKVVMRYIVHYRLGAYMLEYFSTEGKDIVPCIVRHIGYDCIKEMLIWLLYSDLTMDGQLAVKNSGVFGHLIGRLSLWQRTLTWGAGTAYQRDSVVNISSVLGYAVYPPAISSFGNISVLVDNTNNSLPLISDNAPTGMQNALLKTFLEYILQDGVNVFGAFMDLGLLEIDRQIEGRGKSHTAQEGGCLSPVMMLMSTLGYHKHKRNLTGVQHLLVKTKADLVKAILPRSVSFLSLCRRIVECDEDKKKSNKGKILHQGDSLLTIVTFLKRCIFMQVDELDFELAYNSCMSLFLKCYQAHPDNSLVHHELTDVIRFVLLDPAQTRSPSCPILNSLFASECNILEFVVESYEKNTQYRGHMTTVGNSIMTLISTPNLDSSNTKTICSQEFVRQYTLRNYKWREFESKLGKQNEMERMSLGQRHAPLCDGCLKLREDVESFVGQMLDTDAETTGHLEKIFGGYPHHHCKVYMDSDSIKGFLYKKDKKHDHVPIPEPTYASSFIPFPVPMPFHALTFTLTYFGLCRRCDKLWYCDTLQTPNWNTRMKWVIPTSIRKWYSFGNTDGPRGGAHGLQFSTKGYKTFLALTDTWGRQEQWITALQESIEGSSRQMTRKMDEERAKAIEIDNEVDTSEIDFNPPGRNGERFHSYSEESSSAMPRNVNSAPSRKIRRGSDVEKEDFEKYKLRMKSDLFKVKPFRSSSKESRKEGLGMRHIVSTSDLPDMERKALMNLH